MTESLCKHPDVRKFDGIRCCLSCGEAVFETLSPSAGIRTSDATAPYQYTKLNYKLGREIRLIVLLPGNSEDALRCRIIHVNLDDDPIYDAVSYTWATEDGDASLCMNIRCQAGGIIPVTSNCYAVLLQLRRSSGVRRLWVDAICIDQTNINERNHQVGFMDQIYSSARSVRICIQDSSSTTPVVDYGRLFRWLRDGGSGSRADFEASLRLDLYHLLSLRYFSRVWVIQEVALAQEVYLHVNNHILLFDSTVMDRMERLRMNHISGIPSVLKWSACRTTEAGIAACLQAAMSCNATDPRDEVYAVLSLMEPQARSLIPVDYSLNPGAIWGHAIAAIIVTQENLDILSHVGVHHHESSTFLTRQSFMNREDLSAYLARLAAGTPYHSTLPYSKERHAAPWRAQIVVSSSDHPTTSQQSATFFIIGSPRDSSLLPRFRVRAHYIDRIAKANVFMNPWSSQYSQWGYTWDQVPFHQVRGRDVKPLLAYFEADLDNVFPGGSHDYSHTRYDYDHQALVINDRSLALADFSQFHRICQRLKARRRLFTTHFSVGFPRFYSETIGLDTKTSLTQGDEIFAIDGARMLFILRKSDHIGDHYEIVGECYLWAAHELDCWHPGTKKGRWGPGVERPTTEQTRMINIC